MPEPLDAEVTLDLSAALAEIDNLRTELQGAIEEAATAGGDALATAITDATSNAPPVALEGDASAIPPAIDEAVSGAPPVAIEGDASAIPPEIDAAVAGSDPPPIEITADASGATAAVDELGASAGTATGATENLSDSVKGLEGVALLASGEVGGMRTVVQGFGAAAIPAVAGGLAVAGAIGTLAKAGVDATSAEQRFNDVTKQLGITFASVHVGSLNIDLEKLGTEFGSSTAATKNSIATLLQHAQASGFAGDKAKTFASEMFAMGARAVALKPSLGDVATVTDNMERAFSRGGPALSRFGISIDQASIKNLALTQTGKASANQLTLQEKAFAGLTIATEKYGKDLGEVVAKGADNAANKQKAFRAELQNTLESLGKPLVAPMFDLIRAALPAVGALGTALGSLATAALPSITAAVSAVVPVLTALSSAIQFLGPILPPVIDAFLLFKTVGVAAVVIEAIGAAALTTGTELGVLALSEEELAIATETFAGAIDTALGPIGLVAVGIGLVVGALGIFGGSEEDATSKTQDFTDALVANNGALDDNATKVLRSHAESEGITSALAQTGISFSTFSTAIESSNKHLDTFGLTAQSASLNGLNLDTELSKYVATVRSSDPELGRLLGNLQQQGILTPKLANHIVDLANAHALANEKGKERNATGSTDAQIMGQEGDAAGALAQKVSALAATINTSVPTTTGTFQTFQQQAAQAFGPIPTVDSFVDNLNKTAGAVGFWLANIKNLLTQNLPGLAQLVQSQAAPIGNALADAIRNATPAERVAWEQQIEAGTNIMTTGKDTALTLAGQEAQGILGHFQEITPGVTAAVAGVPPAVDNALGAGVGHFRDWQARYHAGGAAVGGAAAQGHQGGVAPIPGDAHSAVSAAVSTIHGLGNPAYTAGAVVGAQFGDGVRGGIASRISGVVAEARKMVLDAVAAAKAAIGVSSPSKATRDELGIPMAQGVAVGIDSGAALAASATSALVLGAVAAGAAVPLPFPGGGYGSHGGDSPISITFKIDVSGVSNPGEAHEVGRAAVRGAISELDGATRRRLSIGAAAQ